MKTGQFTTLAKPVEGVVFKERNSKFLGYAYPVTDETRIEALLSRLRKQHGKANHVCYGWQLGTDPVIWRVNDDGEPNNSAGMPIYGQIQAFGLTNILIAVVRYFGGTKLGVGGLISAYRKTAQLTLEEGKTVTKTVLKNLTVECDYKDAHQVMQMVKRHRMKILSQKNEMRVQFILGIPLNNYKEALDHLRDLAGVTVEGDPELE
ncbi:uncharacterized protein, YigZ family [Muriicola jejuensis]|uniref:YigZ family protein n=1 Tax=Muriicola jejuensis TaxID=504488 RepID=A0A6P0UF12_9FLAO|nr:YigZ family protein [Muriicola jejuensis]NER11050.1 YigZ family protein [Muriicola jejuensis]SMP23204.1 uncharacterized protein, YigZ family [Muriicola jejuensis]